jgi:hypothetical protein
MSRLSKPISPKAAGSFSPVSAAILSDMFHAQKFEMRRSLLSRYKQHTSATSRCFQAVPDRDPEPEADILGGGVPPSLTKALLAECAEKRAILTAWKTAADEKQEVAASKSLLDG